MIKYETILEKCNIIWEKFSNSIKKIKSEPLHDKEYLKIKITSYNGEINTKEGSQCIYISVRLIDSVIIRDKNYYTQSIFRKI